MKNHYLRLIGLAVALLFTVSGCKKAEEEKDTPAPTTASGQLTVHDNVLVIDSTMQKLDHIPALLAVGTYRFRGNSTALQVPVGSVIVGAQGRGFLRKVTSISTQGTTTTLQTTFASLDELFKSGTLTIRSSSDSLHQRSTTGNGFSYTIGNIPLYQTGPLSLTLRSGSVSMNPNWKIEAGFGSKGTINAEVSARGATMDGNFVFNVSATQSATLVDQTSTLTHFYKDFKFIVTAGAVPIPVTVRMNIDLGLQYSATLSAAISRDVTFNSSSTFDAGLAFSNGQWNGIYSLNPVSTLTFGPRSGNANGNVKMALVPKISFQLYEEFAYQEVLAVGPYTSIGLQEELVAAVASPTLDWNFQADAWLRTTVGITGKVFGEQLPDFTKSWDTNKLTYKSPASLERTAGDGQIGQANQPLLTPIKVRVLDSNGAPQSEVPVYFTPANNNGTATPSSVLTDVNGYAQSVWTPSSATSLNGIQYLKATAKMANGQVIGNAPIEFAATVGLTDLQLLTNGSTKIWKATRVIDANGAVVQSCNNIPFSMVFNINMAVRLEQYIANGTNAACVLNVSSPAFLLGNARVLTLRGTTYNGGSVDEFYQITRLDNNNLELSGITDPAKRLSLVY